MTDEPQLPRNLVESANTAAHDAINQCAAIALTLSDVFPADTAQSDALDVILLQALDRYDQIDAAFVVMESQFEMTTQFETLLRPQSFARITPVIGTDCRALAIKYYGNADLWTRIAQQNEFPTSVIPAGVREVIIPLNLPDATDPSTPSV